MYKTHVMDFGFKINSTKVIFPMKRLPILVVSIVFLIHNISYYNQYIFPSISSSSFKTVFRRNKEVNRLRRTDAQRKHNTLHKEAAFDGTEAARNCKQLISIIKQLIGDCCRRSVTDSRERFHVWARSEVGQVG